MNIGIDISQIVYEGTGKPDYAKCVKISTQADAYRDWETDRKSVV